MKHGGLFFALLLLITCTRGLAGTHHPLIAQRSSEPGVPPEITISGLWPDNCVPELEGAEFDRGIIVRATAPRQRYCDAVVTHYSLTIDLEAHLTAHGAGSSFDALPVRFFVRLEGEDVYRLAAFTLATWGTESNGARPESGLWWPAAGSQSGSGPGIGLNLEVQGSEVVVVANVYDQAGEPEWLIGSGLLQGNVFSARLYRLSGGQPMFSDYAPPDQVYDHAQVDIEFHGSASATVWLSRAVRGGLDSQLLLQPIAMERYRFGHDQGQQFWEGSWILEYSDTLTRAQLTPSATGAFDSASRLEIVCAVARAQASSCTLWRDGSQFGAITDIGINRVSGRAFSGERFTLRRIR